METKVVPHSSSVDVSGSCYTDIECADFSFVGCGGCLLETAGFGLREVWEVPGVAPVQTGLQTSGCLCLSPAA